MSAELQIVKDKAVTDIDNGTRKAILAIATLEDQLNIQAEYNLLDPVTDADRIAEIESIWQSINDLRVKGQNKKAAIKAAATIEEIAAAL